MNPTVSRHRKYLNPIGRRKQGRVWPEDLFIRKDDSTNGANVRPYEGWKDNPRYEHLKDDPNGARWDYVYGLCTSGDGLKYIGHSVNPEKRIRDLFQTPTNPRMGEWMQKVDLNSIDQILIDRAPFSRCKATVMDQETFWIYAALQLGFDLLNNCQRGDLCANPNVSKRYEFSISQGHKQYLLNLL